MHPLLHGGRTVPVHPGGRAVHGPNGVDVDAFERDGARVSRERVPLY
jgi:hypothetical protein